MKYKKHYPSLSSVNYIFSKLLHPHLNPITKRKSATGKSILSPNAHIQGWAKKSPTHLFVHKQTMGWLFLMNLFIRKTISIIWTKSHIKYERDFCVVERARLKPRTSLIATSDPTNWANRSKGWERPFAFVPNKHMRYFPEEATFFILSLQAVETSSGLQTAHISTQWITVSGECLWRFPSWVIFFPTLHTVFCITNPCSHGPNKSYKTDLDKMTKVEFFLYLCSIDLWLQFLTSRHLVNSRQIAFWGIFY